MTENPTQSAPPERPSFLDDSFARLRASGYERDTDNRWFGGVCSGLAHRLGVDPVLIRATAVVLAFVGGLGLTAYVVLWLVMPDRRGTILAERALRQGEAGPIALLVLAAFLLVGGIFSIGRGNGWVAPLWLIPVAVVAWFVLSRGRATGATTGPSGTATSQSPGFPSPTPPPPPPGDTMSAPTTTSAAPSAAAPTPQAYGARPAPYGSAPAGQYGQYPGPYGGRPVPPAPPRPVAPPPPPRPRRRRPSAFVGLISLGIAMVGLGLGAALDGPVGFPGSAATLGFLIGLVGVSLVVLALGISGRASGFSGALAVILALLLLSSSAASRVNVENGVGERTWVPLPASGTTSYELGAGDATLDLRRLDSAAATATPQRVTVEMGAGDLTILVPNGLDARVDASVGIGEITHQGGIADSSDVNGTDRSTTTIIGEQPVSVVVDAELGIGQITIQEQ
jgi:phage shock protein PspC (stress-responsive transcriptional regulator)